MVHCQAERFLQLQVCSWTSRDFKQSISSFQQHPFYVILGTIWRRDFIDGLKSSLSLCACLLGVLPQLSKGLLQTLCRILERREGKIVSPLTFNPFFQLLKSAYIFFPGTSSELRYKMSTSKQKPQLCSLMMIPEQSRGHRSARIPFFNSPTLGGEPVLAFVGWT